MSDSRYKMSISLNVLNHLGLNLYSNTPAVLAEAIANAWDADATRVDISFSRDAFIIADNGIGMNLDDINKKYLRIGYEKRKEQAKTKMGRDPMGRKGIGKLSLFSIARKVEVHSRKDGNEESFRMDADEIEEKILKEGGSGSSEYGMKKIPFDGNISGDGTVIKITDMKKKITQATLGGLKKRIARRFGLIGGQDKFDIVVDGKPVTFLDRDYFHKARFLFQYGDYDYSQHCNKLDARDDSGDKAVYKRNCRFDENGNVTPDGIYAISGWIAIARHSHDLDEKDDVQDKKGDAQDENLNKITIVVRGKVAQEDILQENRLGGIITKYMYGEIHADFLDRDDEQDIATSSRQKIIEDDPRYVALKLFIGEELRHIWKETNKLKEKRGMDVAMKSNPFIKEWYDGLHPKALQRHARDIFGAIDKMGVDEERKKDLYANGVLAFERMKMSIAMKEFEKILEEEYDAGKLFSFLADIDAIEAANYGEIVRERLRVIGALRDKVNANEKEIEIQKHVFNHLWLLDPAWERATEDAEMEKVLHAVDAEGDKITGRADIKYRACSGAHVIIELKRPSEKLTKGKVEEQLKKYIAAVEQKRDSSGDTAPIYAFCLVGKPLREWQDAKQKRRDIESLKPYNITIMHYDELVRRAEVAYKTYLKKSAEFEKLRRLIENIRKYTPKSSS